LKEPSAVSKRKPPSQRTERKLDETARALARSRDEAKVDKTDEPPRKEGAKNAVGRLFQNILPKRASTGPAPTPSTKKPKKV
jgi:hypothetical protein